MAHLPSSRLSRQELYSYGFREGQSWGEDRRTLESALREMDQLEREIQENYIYGRPTPNNPYAPSPAIPRQASATPGGYFTPGRYPTPDIRIARSDASDRSSELSSVSPYSGRGYDCATGYQDPVNSGYDNAQPEWRQAPPSNFSRSPSGSAVSQNFPSFPVQYFAPSPPRMSPSTSRHFHSIEDPSNYSNLPPSYGSRASNTSRSSNVADAPAQALSPSQMQLVPYNNDQADYDASEEERYTSPTSPQWSMDATLGTAISDRSISATSSQGMYSEGSALSGYSDMTRSSGYVESYDVASYGDYRDYHNDSEDDHDYMSDDIASNEGEYYSSGEEPEYEGEGDDVYSDEGYSDSYDDGSYSSD